jgi:hypothetical protein
MFTERGKRFALFLGVGKVSSTVPLRDGYLIANDNPTTAIALWIEQPTLIATMLTRLQTPSAKKQ